MKLLLFGLGLCLQLVLCHSEVCIPTWTPYPRSFSIGGTNESSARQLQDCLARCERRSNCLAVDFNVNTDIYCWLHYDLSNFDSGSFYENALDNVAQYRISRNCTDYGKAPECPAAWTQNTSVGSYYGEQVNYWTEYDCFTYCRYSNTCVAVDYNNKTSPPCWIHKDSNPNNASKDSEGVVQYRLNKTCPSIDNSTKFHIGRCVGQYFPTTGWCPTGAKIHINFKDASFKINPLCYYRNAEDAYPPDSSSLVSLAVWFFDPSYINEINSSCDGQSDCNSSIRAKSNSALENCPDGQICTNFVSIAYQCISDGSMTSEEMTTKTTGTTPVATATVTTTVATATVTTTITPSGIDKAASNENSKENSDRLIIGLVIGLGVPLILIIIIIVIVILVRRRRRKETSEPKESYRVHSDYYTVQTMPRGAIPENQQNEISMAVDAL